MGNIEIAIIEAVVMFALGAFMNHIFMLSKFKDLQEKIDELIDQVQKLNVRDKTIDKLVDKYLYLEERISSVEAEQRVLQKYIERVEQEIVK